MVGVDGITKLTKDLGIDPEDIVLMIIARHCRSKEPGEFSHKEFVEGMTALRCDTVDKLREKLPSLRAELNDEDAFRDLYMFMFDYGRPPQQKSLPLEVAIELWQLTLGSRFKFINQWVEYLKVCMRACVVCASLALPPPLPSSTPICLLAHIC